MQRMVQGRHGTVNAHLKSFKILDEVYRHDTQHGYVFRAFVVIVQLALKNRDPLFDVNYKTIFD